MSSQAAEIENEARGKWSCIRKREGVKLIRPGKLEWGSDREEVPDPTVTIRGR